MNVVMSENKYMYKKITYPGVPENRYIVSEIGEIVDTLKNRTLNQYEDRDGYLRCTINGRNYLIHRLVAWDFCMKNRDLQLTVDHCDGKKKNNYYKNLEWVTSAENTRRAIANGLRNGRGENSSTNKYSQDFVESICVLLSNGYPIMDVFYRITERDQLTSKIDLNNPDDRSLYNLIYRLYKKEIWPDVVSKYNFPEIAKSKKSFIPIEGKSRFTADQVHQICQMHLDGKSVDEILDELKVDCSDPKESKRYHDACRSILLGRNWTNISSQYFESRFRKSGRTLHKLDDDKITEMLNKRYPREYIQKELNPDNDRLIRKALNKRIHNYLVLNNIKKYEAFDINTLNN